MTLVLSLDLGTGSARAGVYDAESHVMKGMGEAAYPTVQAKRGWAEQNPDDWWRAIVTAVRAAIEAAGSGRIAAVGVATTASTTVTCRRDGTPLRPAILWMDCRAAPQAHFTETISHPVLAYSGGGDASEWLVPKAMWLAENEPAVYREAGVICEAIDYVNFRLTGAWAGSRLNATCKWNYDSIRKRFYPELFAAFGVPDLLDKIPNRIVPVGSAVEVMRAEVAAELGIEGRPIVAQGGIDAHIAVFGADTVAPGSMLMIGGTSVVHLAHAAEQPDLPGIWGPYPNALVDGLWLIEGGQVSAGAILSWYAEKIFGLDRAGHAALIEEASKRETGTSGLVTLDFWMGNRTPYRDPDLRGALLGLSLWHDRATIYRSAVEAVALGSANVVGGLVDQGLPVERLVIAGGICKNPLWLRSTIDAIGVPVRVSPSDNLSLVGAAVSSIVALGLEPDLAAAARACVAPGQEIEPSATEHCRWREMLAQYRETIATVGPVTRNLSMPSERAR